MRNGLLATGMVLGVLAGAVAAIPAEASMATDTSVVMAAGAHEGKRCHKKGKVVTVGHNKWDKVKLKCTVVRRGDRTVKVWKYHGRA